jgi:hypothetical protein
VLAGTPALARRAGQHSTSSSRCCMRLQHSVPVRQLQLAGACLNDMPFSWGFNNLACSNLTGPSGLQLVKGKPHSCQGCRTACYCGRGCQTAHWTQHKGACKALEGAPAVHSTARPVDLSRPPVFHCTVCVHLCVDQSMYSRDPPLSSAV